MYEASPDDGAHGAAQPVVYSHQDALASGPHLYGDHLGQVGAAGRPHSRVGQTWGAKIVRLHFR